MLAQNGYGDPNAPTTLPFWVYVVVTLGCLIIAVVFSVYVSRFRGRQDAAQTAAEAAGFTYYDSDARGVGRLKFREFSGADSIGISHLMTGISPKGTNVTVFDYTRETEIQTSSEPTSRIGMIGGLAATNGASMHSGKSKIASGATRSGAIVEVLAYFPRLVISPQGAVRRTVNNITGNDIKFESDHFNRAYQVTSEDRGFAHLFITPDIIDLLLRSDGEIGLETMGDSILVITDLIDGRRLPSLGLFACRLAEQISQLAVNEYPPPNLVDPGVARRPFL